MQIEDLNTYVLERAKAQKPFVLYRLSGYEKLFYLEANAVQVLPQFSLDTCGFLFHPFDASKHNIELIEGNAQELSLAAFKSTSIQTEEISQENNLHVSTFEEYKSQFDLFQEEFAHKRMKKAILSRIKLVEKERLNIHSIFTQLLEKYKEAYVYLYFSPSAGLWLGASPEKFVALHENILETTALAGTISEGENWSNKEMEEQMVVTHFLTQNLHDLDSLEADAPETIKAGNLYHIRANIRGTFNKNTNLPELINRLHPTPAVGGFPKAKALEMIASTEKHDREYYSGFAGPISPNGNSHFFVNLRCGKIFNKGIALFVGGGITKSSVVEKEWEETEKKAGTLSLAIL
ncbi:MAG: isochorismate synthase [Flavobacteriales bacterium]